MFDKVPVKVLEQIFRLLESGNRRLLAAPSDRLVDGICRNRWAHRRELEDLLLCSDSRGNHLDLDGLAAVFELPQRWVYNVPRFETSDACGSQGLSVVDAAALFIQLEAIGFDGRA